MMPSILVVMALGGSLLGAELQGRGRSVPAADSGPERIELSRGWSLQSSARLTAAGPTISSPDFAARGWYQTTLPSTVVGALVEAGVYPDPYFHIGIIGAWRPRSTSGPYEC